MPKVTDEYLDLKKNLILDCAGEILKEKPLYLITMRDIIKKANFSQGAIYRYFANLDEIYIAYINKNTRINSLRQRVDTILGSDKAEKDILKDCFAEMGFYIEELMKTVVGKTFFELMVLYSYDFEKRDAIFPRLEFKQGLEYAKRRIIECAMGNIEKGVFQPKIPVNAIINFVGIFIDGISHSMTINTGDDSRNMKPAANIPEMFQTLAETVINFLEV